MIYYEPIKIEYTEEQIKLRNECLEKYTNNKEFKELVDRINDEAKQQTSKTFRRRNDKKNKGQEKCFLQKIRKILASFSNCFKRIFTQK